MDQEAGVMQGCDCERGFTLPEVILAVLISAMLIAGAGTALIETMTNVPASQQRIYGSAGRDQAVLQFNDDAASAQTVSNIASINACPTAPTAPLTLITFRWSDYSQATPASAIAAWSLDIHAYGAGVSQVALVRTYTYGTSPPVTTNYVTAYCKTGDAAVATVTATAGSVATFTSSDRDAKIVLALRESAQGPAGTSTVLDGVFRVNSAPPS